MPKVKDQRRQKKHDPLEVQMAEDYHGKLKTKGHDGQGPARRPGAGRAGMAAAAAKAQRAALMGEDEVGDVEVEDESGAHSSGRPSKSAGKTSFVEGRMGKKLLEVVSKQQVELEADEDVEAMDNAEAHLARLAEKKQRRITGAALRGVGGAGGAAAAAAGGASDDDGVDADGDVDDEDDEQVYGADGEALEDHAEEVELTEADRQALEMFMPAAAAPRRNLADVLMEKIKEKEAIAAASQGAASAAAYIAANGGGPDDGDVDGEGAAHRRGTSLHPKVIQASQRLGQYLRHFTSGKVPKLLKVVPQLKNWEEILFFAEADKWTPQAIGAATRLFASNLNPHLATRYFNLVLLPRVRADIEANKTLNHHLYMAVRKSIFKPMAFFKGIILPLAADGCTAREAMIFSSILSTSSIPGPHAGVALYRLTQLPYSGPTALFIKTLINKKYALPISVLNAVCDYYLSFIDDDRDFPVLWHQGLLSFVQRYKGELAPEQRDGLKQLSRRKVHATISDEVRRELLSATILNATPAVMFSHRME